MSDIADMVKIYKMLYENKPNVIYIGKTTNLKNRLAGHRYKNSQYTNIELIDSVPSTEWKFWEEYYICL